MFGKLTQTSHYNLEFISNMADTYSNLHLIGSASQVRRERIIHYLLKPKYHSNKENNLVELKHLTQSPVVFK